LIGFLVMLVAFSALPAATASSVHMNPTASGTVRGIYRFSSTAWSTLAQDGFNWVTDGGTNTNNYAGQRAAGLSGMVWLDAYDNSSCQQTMSDAEITQVVRTNVSGGNAGAIYQVGDEPTTNGCVANPTYTHMTSVIHAADGTAKTWVADDQFNDPSISNWPAGLPMKGSVDILAFDIYPCQAGPCQFNMIDSAIQRIHSVGLRNWEFILQDFGPCESWRAPTAQEVTQQFQHWQGAGALGYWIYTYDSDSSCPGNVAGTPELRLINSMAVNPTAAPPPASPVTVTPRPKPSPVATSSPRASPTSSAASGSAAPSPSADAPSKPPDLKSAMITLEASGAPLIVVAVGALLAIIGVGLSYLRRRTR
jgi:hypothetical protein